MESRRVQLAFESMLVMLLLIIFAISSCVMIIEGSKSYENIIEKRNSQEDIRVAFSYINMRIKQNDVAGQIQVLDDFYRGQDVLQITYNGDEEDYVTYIFGSEGYLYECYTDYGMMPEIELSSRIAKIDALEVNWEPSTGEVRFSVSNMDQELEGIVAIQSKSMKE